MIAENATPLRPAFGFLPFVTQLDTMAQATCKYASARTTHRGLAPMRLVVNRARRLLRAAANRPAADPDAEAGVSLQRHRVLSLLP